MTYIFRSFDQLIWFGFRRIYGPSAAVASNLASILCANHWHCWALVAQFLFVVSTVASPCKVEGSVWLPKSDISLTGALGAQKTSCFRSRRPLQPKQETLWHRTKWSWFWVRWLYVGLQFRPVYSFWTSYAVGNRKPWFGTSIFLGVLRLCLLQIICSCACWSSL